MKIAIPIDFNDTTYKINKAYINYIVESNMTPVIITPDSIRLLKQCKGLLLPGGIDIDPMYYGIDNYSAYSVNPEKDEFERAMFYKAIKYQLPIFGICRGFQLIMYETLLTYNEDSLPMEFRQHIGGHAQPSDISVARGIKTHMVNIDGSSLYGIGNITETGVNSMHHQGVVLSEAKKNIKLFGKIHQHINIVAWSDKLQTSKDEDSIIVEGVKVNLWGNSIMAVQWHPEELRDIELLKNFFNESDTSKPKPLFLDDNFKLKLSEN